ncbi:hypothetical protein GQ55_1G050000 [Panicum hallii var. hallii]|uniref:Uncharacterized protein n=1 Tax=Panicum hallii var. hallii TaxID=1504633 RepID=A0A2T7F2G5_9POAL|nr:hypothetical protein GQ55_1G050000 [Panicum hallii var. hallii]
MMSAAASPDESPVQQAPPHAGVPPIEGPAHAVAPNPGGRRPDESPIQQTPHAVVALEESSGQQSPNSSGRRPSQEARDGDRRDEGPDRRLSPTSGSSPRPAQRRPPGDGHGLGSLSWLEFFGFLFLSYNSGMAVYQSWGDVAAISVVAFMFVNIASLVVCLKLFQAAPPNSTGRNRLRASAWLLTMSLTFGYVYQVIGTATRPTLQVALLQWAMPAATGIAVFILFCQEDRSAPPLAEELLDVV